MEDDFFGSLRIAVVGLGLMGGSLALGLRDHCRLLLAVDPDAATRQLAIREGIVDRISDDPAEILPLADLVILAAPVDAILEIIPLLPGLHPGSPVVLDLGSTKAAICQMLGELPSRFEPIGGHPMCGKAEGGLFHADVNLFKGANFIFSSLPNSSMRARHWANRLATMLGAQPVWLEPDLHDHWIAITSHLPYLLSSALVLATPIDASALIGPGFLSTSRLASSPHSVMFPILMTNRSQVLGAIAGFRDQLDQIENALKGEDFPTLRKVLLQSVSQKAALTEKDN
jgi:prephenate dehydrogenase